MKKRAWNRTLALGLALCLALTPTVWAAPAAETVALQLGNNRMAVDSRLTQVDAQNALVTPFAENGRTLVPVSRIVDAFGGESTWDAATNATTFTLDGRTVRHVIGTNTVVTPDGTKTMEALSKAVNDRTYVPVRYVLEGLGLWVGWDQADQLVVVSRKDLSGADLGSLSQSMRVSGRMGDLSAIGTRPCVPDPMAYFGLEERDYTIEPADGYFGGEGVVVNADLKLVKGSDKRLLDGFVSTLDEFGFQLTQVDATEQDTAQFGAYTQTLYFRYTGPGADKVAFLGETYDGAEYDFMVEYCNFYKANGASRDKTVLTYMLADGLEPLAVGVTDGDWNVEPYETQTLPGRPSRTVVYQQNGKTSYAPDLMAYFGVGAEAYTRDEIDGGYALRATLKLVPGSDGQLLNDFAQLMYEQGFQFKHVATAVQNTAQYGAYAQSLYFRYVGPDADRIAHLGQWDGKDYDLCLNYCNFYAAGGSSRDRTNLDVLVSKDLTVVDTGVRDSRWKVTAEVKPTPGGPGTGTGTGSGDGSGSGSGGWTPGVPSKPGGVRCGVCGGDGKRECVSCSGRGYFERRKSTPNYSGKGPKYYTVKETCGACRGTGEKPCTYCGGDGKVGN